MTRTYPTRDISDCVARLRQHYIDTGANYAQEAADKLELLEGEIGSNELYIARLRAEIECLQWHSELCREDARRFYRELAAKRRP